jgi:hypothetical protein
MQPDGTAGAGPGPAADPNQQQQGRSAASVLHALQEQTQRTVEQQARARPPPAAAGAGAGAGGGEDQQQMSMIVDVVMQHLLSKDVLYQPMKVRHQQQQQMSCTALSGLSGEQQEDLGNRAPALLRLADQTAVVLLIHENCCIDKLAVLLSVSACCCCQHLGVHCRR